MSWDVTMLFLHLTVLAGLAVLYRHGPDAMQKLVIGLLSMAMLTMVVHYVGKVIAAAGLLTPDLLLLMGAEEAPWEHVVGFLQNWRLGMVAYVIEHVAVILYVLRLFVSDQERRCLMSSSGHSRNSRV